MIFFFFFQYSPAVCHCFLPPYAAAPDGEKCLKRNIYYFYRRSRHAEQHTNFDGRGSGEGVEKSEKPPPRPAYRLHLAASTVTVPNRSDRCFYSVLFGRFILTHFRPHSLISVSEATLVYENFVFFFISYCFTRKSDPFARIHGL